MIGKNVTFVPLPVRQSGGQRRSSSTQNFNVTLLEGVARGFYWQQLVDTGAKKSASEIAKEESLNPSVVSELMRLTLLAPEIIEMLMTGGQPRKMYLLWFQRNPLPLDWNRQWEVVRSFEAPR